MAEGNNNLDKQVEGLFNKAKNQLESKMRVETVPEKSPLEVRVFGEGSSYTVLVKSIASVVVGQNKGGTVVYQGNVNSAKVAVGLGDRFSAYLQHEKEHPCSVDLTYLPEDAKRKMGIIK